MKLSRRFPYNRFNHHFDTILDKDTLSISNSPKSDMVINLPLDTVKLLNFIAKKYDVQISDIVFTALGHIIPVLMTYIEECGGYDEK